MRLVLAALLPVALACTTLACTTLDPKAGSSVSEKTAVTAEVSRDTVAAGTSVSRGGQKMALAKGRLGVDEALPSVSLVDQDWQQFKFAADGRVKVVSVVPSVDTKVCEEQTHVLGETETLDPKVQRITLSRDLPAAQKRFAKEARLTNVTYVSDFKTGDFGKAAGLLIEESGLLARAVMVVDGDGKVRYLQIVPDVTKLPDMERAFVEANKLAR